jgi:hypothetical protein
MSTQTGESWERFAACVPGLQTVQAVELLSKLKNPGSHGAQRTFNGSVKLTT